MLVKISHSKPGAVSMNSYVKLKDTPNCIHILARPEKNKLELKVDSQLALDVYVDDNIKIEILQ